LVTSFQNLLPSVQVNFFFSLTISFLFESYANFMPECSISKHYLPHTSPDSP
jgi:hypothetical protein